MTPNALRLSIILAATSIVSVADAQQDTWYAYYNSDSTLVGYKDQKGNVKLEPNLAPEELAPRFDAIMAIRSYEGEAPKLAYITKSGRQISGDSMYFYDNTPDCESEGFIRFRDRETDLVGMLDSQGDVAVPALYSHLSQVHNGLIIALQGASKRYLDTAHSGCQHYIWEGGTQLLLDTKNQVLIEGIDKPYKLDLYTAQYSTSPSADSTRLTYPTVDGGYFSFYTFESRFERWIDSIAAQEISPSLLLSISSDSITYYQGERKVVDKQSYIRDFYTSLKNLLLQTKDPSIYHHVTKTSTNPLVFALTDVAKYTNNCGQPLYQKYPIMSLHIDLPNQLGQSALDFLYTGAGYLLIHDASMLE